MDKLLMIGIPLAIILLLVLVAIGIYNKLVYSREYVRNAMGNIAAAVESRWDALSNLIQATEKYSAHEADTLKAVTAQRSGVSSTSTTQEIVKDDQLFEKAMDRINVVVEQYPQLKADQVYLQTMNSVNQYEDTVRKSRMIYNDTVTKYNRQVLSFPTSILAGMFGFRQEEYFKNTETKADMPMWS